MGILYIVATPIGNLQDISLRAMKMLLTAQVIACEDTRKTGLLLKQLQDMYNKLTYYTEIGTDKNIVEANKVKLISYYEQNELRRISEIISLLQQGVDVILVSDAGTPTISDPGFKLIRECISKNIEVQTIPGPSAMTAALSVSGLPTDRFFFVGYPPKKDGHRKAFWRDLQKAKEELHTTIILYEAPHRIISAIAEMIGVFGENQYVVFARELTKLYEETRRGSLKEMQDHFAEVEPKGEFVILF